MSTQIEAIRDTLTILKLADEVPMTADEHQAIVHVCKVNLRSQLGLKVET